MKVEEFNWRSGRVEHWSLDRMTADKPISDHDRWELNEDLALICFPGKVCLDVGWYPQGSFEGRFVVQVILDEDWRQPLKKWKCATVQELVGVMSEAISSADVASLSRVSN